MKFIHAADLHIDSPMRGLSRYEGAPEDRLRGASREAFTQLVSSAIEEKVDLVVLAGDVFDGDWADYQTGLFFVNGLTDLTSAGIKVVVLAGNHDAESKLTRHLRFPQGAFKLDHDAPQTLQPEQLSLDVAIHGQSYATRDVSTNLVASYPRATPGVLNIGVLHTALNGRPGHGNYAPCRLDDLVSKGYDYWALGHIHKREVVSSDPWVVFPGNLQGRSIRETGPKGFTLVQVTDGRITDVAHRDADTARWFHSRVDASGVTSEHELLGLVSADLRTIASQAAGRLAAVRVTVEGTTKLHGQLAGHRETLAAEVRALAYAGDADLWVEKVEIETVGVIDRAQILNRNDALSGLFDTIDHLRRQPHELPDRFVESFEKLRTKLPPETFTTEDDPFGPKRLAQALDAAESHLVAILGGAGDQ